MPQDSILNPEIKRPNILDARVKLIDMAVYGVLMHIAEEPVPAEALENSVPFEVAPAAPEPRPRPEEVIEQRIVENHEANAQRTMQADAEAKLAELFAKRSEN